MVRTLALPAFTETYARVCLLGFIITSPILIPWLSFQVPASTSSSWMAAALVWCWVAGQRCCRVIAPRQGTGTPQPQDTEVFLPSSDGNSQWFTITLKGNIQSALNLREN